MRGLMLCSTCQGIRLTELVPFDTSGEDEIETCQVTNTKEGHLLHPSFEALERSGTQNECELCSLIVQVLEEDQTWNDDDKIYGSSRGDSERDLVLQLRTGYSAEIYLYRVEGSERQEDAGIFEIAVVPTFSYQELPAASRPGNGHHAFYWRALEVWAQSGERIGGLTGYAHHRHIATDPLSGTATGIFKHWFSECRNAHSECSVDETVAMPTRVIDVGPADGSLQPRLHPTGAEVGQWATLSHCWGKTVTIKLTSDTFEERLRGIPMAEMPRNFRDAIVVTRMLGIRYLWIDSLCIIQDSSEDWLQESAKMGEIYKNCLITIAATNAHESAAGFLLNRSAEVACHLRIDKDLTIPVYVRPKIEWYGSPEIVGPLSRRGWVLQERLLPLRILHFGGQQTMWQCRTKSLAEAFCDTDHALEEQIPGIIESSLRTTFHAKKSSLANNNADDQSSKAKTAQSSSADSSLAALPHQKNLPSSFKETENNNNIYEQWYRLIEIYARLALTNSTDKLAAVAGIAQQVQIRTGDTYLAGLWKSDIRRGLEWWSNPPSILVRPSSPQAPSWSWASLNLPTSSSSNYDPSATLSTSFFTPLDDQEHGVQLVAFDRHLTDYGCLGNSSGSITLLGLWADAEFVVTAATTDDDDDDDDDDDVLESESQKTRFSLSYPLPLILKGGGRQKKQQKQPCTTTTTTTTAAAAVAVRVAPVGARARLDVAANAKDYNQTEYEIGCLQTGKFSTEGPRYPRAEFVSALLLLRRRSGGTSSTTSSTTTTTTSNNSSKGQGGCVRQQSYCRIGLAVILENCDDDGDRCWERRQVEII